MLRMSILLDQSGGHEGRTMTCDTIEAPMNTLPVLRPLLPVNLQIDLVLGPRRASWPLDSRCPAKFPLSYISPANDAAPRQRSNAY